MVEGVKNVVNARKKLSKMNELLTIGLPQGYGIAIVALAILLLWGSGGAGGGGIFMKKPKEIYESKD